MAPVVDLGWWSDDLMLLAFATGEVIISPLEKLQNLLGLSGTAETFEKYPSLTNMVDGKAFVLEYRQQSVAVTQSSAATSTDHLINR